MTVRTAAKGLGFVTLLGTTALLTVQAFPGAVGADIALVVQSGSMEPAIPTGSVVFVSHVPSGNIEERIQEGDVITFSKTGTIETTTTHRVVEKHVAGDSVRFITKGDANGSPDGDPVYRDEVVGVVEFSVPFIGYLISFSGTFAGWTLLIVLPVVGLLMDGLWQVYEAVEPGRQTG